MSAIRHKKKKSRRFQKIVWSMGLFFVLGYLPSVVLKTPQTAILATVLAATCGVIPFGMRAKTVLRGAVYGATLGYIAGMSAVLAIAKGKGVTLVSTTTAPTTVPMTTTVPAQEEFAGFFLAYPLAVAGFCAIVAAGFAHLASKRRRRVEDEWE